MASTNPVPDPAYVEANRDVAGRVVDRLTATGLLADPVSLAWHEAPAEAEKLRDFLNVEIPNVRGGGLLDDSFKRMRRSARDFARAAGPRAETFAADPAYFEACLRAMSLTLRDEATSLTTGFALS